MSQDYIEGLLNLILEKADLMDFKDLHYASFAELPSETICYKYLQVINNGDNSEVDEYDRSLEISYDYDDE